MSTKLTLSLDSRVINFAKKIANKKNTSLSKIVENYFKTLIHQDSNSKEFSKHSEIRSLKGLYKAPVGISDKQLLVNALKKKHL